MVTLAQAIADPATQWCRGFTIEGHGEEGRLLVYASQAPDNEASMTSVAFRTWIEADSWPTSIKESVPPLGGIASAGAFSVDVVDIEDTLTSEWRTDSAPVAFLDQAATAATGVLTVIDDAGISDGDYLWIGDECVLVASAPIANAVPVTRAQYGTTAFAHPANAPVYAYTPSIEGRELILYLFPRAADDWSSTSYWEVGRFRVDTVALGHDLNTWHLEAKSDLRMLTRQLASRRFEGTAWVNGNNDNFELLFQPPVDEAIRDPWNDGEGWFHMAKGIVLLNLTTQTQIRANELGTPLGTTSIRNGPLEFQQVYGADPRGPSPFRWSRTNLQVRTSQWEKVDHPIDILLCLLTSSAHDDDGLEVANGDATYGNWSGLPIGMGLGIPAANIDFASFVAYKEKTDWLSFPNFWVGDKAEELSQRVTREILIPLRAHLTKPAGQIVFRAPRLPLQGDSATSWTISDPILSEEVAPGRRRPLWGPPNKSQEILYTTVEFVVPRSVGEGKTTVRFVASDQAGWGVQRANHANTDRTLSIEINSVTDAQHEMLQRLAMRHLFRTKQTLWRTPASTGYDQQARSAGDLVTMTHADMPDLASGARGWTDVPLELIEREVSLQPGRNGARIDWTTLGFGPGVRFGKVAPSAYVTDVDGPDGSGNYTCTVYGNLYTDVNTLDPDLPTSDPEAFTAADVVELINPDGSSLGIQTAAVVSTTSTTIVLDGNMSGNLAAGTIIVYADYDSSVSDQRTGWTYWASTTTSPPKVGNSDEDPWLWGE